MDASTARFLEAYVESRVSPKLFLSSFFGLTDRNIYESESITVDIRRGEPRIAVPVAGITAGARKIEDTVFENRAFTAPTIKLEGNVSAWSTQKRRPGKHTFEDPDVRAAVLDDSFRIMGEAEDMTRRTVELMAGQVLTTGAISLVDSTGAVQFALNFQPRTSHFITVGTAWHVNGSAGNPLGDIEGACKQVRRNGKMRATDVLFGSEARRRFALNTNVRAQLDNIGLQALQDIAPQDMPDDATYFGSLVIGNYRLRCWEYDADYIHPSTLEPTPYLDDLKVVVLARDARRDLTFGSIPQIVPPESRAAQFLPSRMNSLGERMDLTLNAWFSPDGTSLNVSAGTRPLPIPTALDCHACLTVA